MYYLILRILVLLIIFLCFYLIRKKKGTMGSKRSKKAVIISVMVIILINAIVFIPYESPFIRFNSAEASVRYCSMNYYVPSKTVETDKTAFCIGHESNDFYFNIITKYDDKYGFCNRHCRTVFGYKNEHIDDGIFNGFYDVTILINDDTNEKCYLIGFYSIDPKDSEDICIYDEHNNPIERIIFPYSMKVYYTIVVDQIDKNTSFTFNGNAYELD